MKDKKQTDTAFIYFPPEDKKENSKLVKKYEDEIKRGLTAKEIIEDGDEDEITEDDYN